MTIATENRTGSGSLSRWARGGVRSFLLVFFGAIAAGVVFGYIVGGGSRGRAPTQSEALAAVDAKGDAEADVVGDGNGAGSNPYAGFRVTDFALIDSDGSAVDQSIFDGEVTVLTFFFTSCNGPCPAIARVMKDVQSRTEETGLRLASISVDGTRDTPAVIASFAESYGADPARWRFITGDSDRVRELVRESIGFELREQEDVQVADPTGAMMNNILHPTRLLLVGPDRRLLGVYAFNDADAVNKLIADAAAFEKTNG